MGRSKSGPTLKKLMILIAVLVAIVLVYRIMTSMQLDLLSKQSGNRVYYERMYSEVSNEVADWRQRYDREKARADENLEALRKVHSHAKQLQEEIETLKEEIVGLKQKGNVL